MEIEILLMTYLRICVPNEAKDVDIKNKNKNKNN